MTLVWFSFDYRIPSQDEAGHILNSMVAADLLAQFRPWQYHWWYHGLTISSFYPPTAYFINGVFLLIFGHSRVVEHLYMAFYAGLTLAAVYGITRFLRGLPLASAVCASSCTRQFQD
jgi:4-amino-4-deoxy-L-arabinose transferase-like glycosyltransferase